jgi:D-glycero-D-manno-heptose 1,7-bisphosphate phosphatase
LKRAAFLDRDGVINAISLLNGIPIPPRKSDDVIILDGVVEAVGLLKEAGFVPVVVTNQPDVARGKTSRTLIEEINQTISSQTGIDFFYICFHDDVDGCECRKPKAGLLIQAAKNLKLDLSRSFLVGDRWRDISAGLAAGVACYFIDYSYGERLPEQPFIRVSSLLEAAHLVIGD